MVSELSNGGSVNPERASGTVVLFMIDFGGTETGKRLVSSGCLKVESYRSILYEETPPTGSRKFRDCTACLVPGGFQKPPGSGCAVGG